MPYKDKEKQRAAAREWARRNKDNTNFHRTNARRKSRDIVQSIKEKTPCADCGQHYPYFVMDFDHREDVDKLAHVATMVGKNAAHKKVMEEIDKCDVVCANCHRIRTARRAGRYASVM
jgi:hypothetical protein